MPAVTLPHSPTRAHISSQNPPFQGDATSRHAGANASRTEGEGKGGKFDPDFQTPSMVHDYELQISTSEYTASCITLTL